MPGNEQLQISPPPTPEEQGSGPRGGNLAESLMSIFPTELAQTVHACRDMNQINSASRTLLLIAKVFFS